jgi:hypothetical protein
MRSVGRIVCGFAVALSAAAFAGGSARAQNVFCPTSFGTQSGIHFDVNECTNGNTGAYSNAALAAQALTDLSQSSTQDSTKAAMAGVASRRTAEQEGCPDGFTRIAGECRRSTAQATPFAAEPKSLSGAWRALPAEFQAASFPVQAYAASDRMPVKAFAPPPPRTLFGSWIQIYGEYERRTGRGFGPGEEFSVLALDAKSTAKSTGVVGGVDVTLRGLLAPGDGLITGILAGYLTSTLDVGTTSTSTNPALTPGGFNTMRARLTGPSVGLYASYFNGGFSTDFAFKADFLDMNVSNFELLGFGANAALGIVATMVPFASSASTSLVSYTTTGNVNYRVPLTSSIWLQPTAGFQYIRTNYASDAAQLGLDDGYLVRLQGGMRVGLESIWGYTPVTTTFTGLLYDNVIVQGGVVQNGLVVGANPLIFNDMGLLRGQGTLAFNFLHGNGLSSFLLGEVRGGKDLFGAAAKAGARIVW